MPKHSKFDLEPDMQRMKSRIVLVANIIAGSTMPVRGQDARQKPASKTPAATKKTVTAPDFSVLAAFKDALLDLKGAVDVGVNREDCRGKRPF